MGNRHRGLVHSRLRTLDIEEVGPRITYGRRDLVLVFCRARNGRAHVRSLRRRRRHVGAIASAADDRQSWQWLSLHFFLVGWLWLRRQSRASGARNLRIWQYVSPDLRTIELPGDAGR